MLKSWYRTKSSTACKQFVTGTKCFYVFWEARLVKYSYKVHFLYCVNNLQCWCFAFKQQYSHKVLISNTSGYEEIRNLLGQRNVKSHSRGTVLFALLCRDKSLLQQAFSLLSQLLDHAENKQSSVVWAWGPSGFVKKPVFPLQCNPIWLPPSPVLWQGWMSTKSAEKQHFW